MTTSGSRSRAPSKRSAAADPDADLLAAERVADRYAADGYRVLALAERWVADVPARLDEAERGLHLLGLIGMADPPRAASAPSIAACRAAGITPIMITGDHPLTAAAIARRIGSPEGDRP
jgi:Ca2+-transporting ATPase